MPPTKTQNPNIDIETKNFHLSLSERTCVMGVLNVTPDSFSEEGKFYDKDRALAHAIDMARDGASIIDVGGESTRPGASAVGLAEELARVVPVIRTLAERVRVPISIDTTKAEVTEVTEGGEITIAGEICREVRYKVKSAWGTFSVTCWLGRNGLPKRMCVTAPSGHRSITEEYDEYVVN